MIKLMDSNSTLVYISLFSLRVMTAMIITLFSNEYRDEARLQTPVNDYCHGIHQSIVCIAYAIVRAVYDWLLVASVASVATN